MNVKQLVKSMRAYKVFYSDIIVEFLGNSFITNQDKNNYLMEKKRSEMLSHFRSVTTGISGKIILIMKVFLNS